jgi:hypothetical protein
MATKKECDRCLSQWEINLYDETCTIAVNLPQWSKGPRSLGWDEKNRVEKVYELCQKCARTIVELLETKGSVDKSS